MEQEPAPTTSELRLHATTQEALQTMLNHRRAHSETGRP